jgi:peptide/nickel transport system ATP-binding protein
MTTPNDAGPPGALIHVRDLTVGYGGRQVASLPDLDLLPGQCIALVGESGSGKSTCLLALLGLLDRNAQAAGTISALGVDVLGASPAQLRTIRGSRIALVMQSPQGSFNPTTRFATLMRRSLALHGVSGNEARRRIDDSLASVYLSKDILRRYPHEVSGGQAQRLAIALAVALGAEVIVADEPTSALDVTVQAEVIGLLQRLRVERGLAVLLVSHDLALVSTVADRIIVMRSGEVVDDGTPEQILRSSEVAYTRDLLAAVPVLERADD